MITNLEGKNLILEFESFQSKPYLCSAGKPTIGYGTTYYPNGVKVTLKDAPITKEKALEYFSLDLIRFEKYINKKAQVDLTPNQFSAMVSFAYNLGEGALTNSTDTGVLQLTNQKRFKEAAEKMLEYCKEVSPKSGKLVVSPGLVRRRKAEKALYLK